MAEYLIQSETLDDIADAINAKTGGSSAMTPAQMVTAIGTISGGGDNPVAVSIGTWLSGSAVNMDFSDEHITSFGLKRALREKTTIRRVYAPYVTSFNEDGVFLGCSNLLCMRLPALSNAQTASAFQSCSKLKLVDWGVANLIRASVFNDNAALKVLILRRSTAITSLQNVNAFAGSTLASGGSGCTIYIPKALYDHLDDGTSLDYKAATNWSTIDGYGTITWAQLEGSIYEDPNGNWTEETT